MTVRDTLSRSTGLHSHEITGFDAGLIREVVRAQIAGHHARTGAPPLSFTIESASFTASETVIVQRIAIEELLSYCDRRSIQHPQARDMSQALAYLREVEGCSEEAAMMAGVKISPDLLMARQ